MANATNNSTASGTGSPCGACKFLRRKCAADCIFAPYFSSDQGAARFAAVHKVFGASNVSKLLLHVPAAERYEAVVTVVYEAQARIRDPVYGCVAHIFALQQQVAYLQAQLMQAKAQLAQNVMSNARNMESGQHLPGNFDSPKSSLDSIHHHSNYDMILREGGVYGDEYCSSKILQSSSSCFGPQKCRSDPNCDLGELHALAFRMMRN